MVGCLNLPLTIQPYCNFFRLFGAIFSFAFKQLKICKFQILRRLTEFHWGLISTMNARKMYVRKWNKDNKWKATRKQNLKVERGLTFMSADVCPDVNIRDPYDLALWLQWKSQWKVTSRTWKLNSSLWKGKQQTANVLNSAKINHVVYILTVCRKQVRWCSIFLFMQLELMILLCV